MGQMRASLEFAKRYFGRRIITAVETGVAAGENALKIRDNLRINKIYLIDTWSPKYSDRAYDWIIEVFKKFEGDRKAVIIREEAASASGLFQDKSIDYLYIDDSHSPDHVKREIEVWLPKMASKGIIAGHDYVEGLGRVDKAVKEKFGYFEYSQNNGEKVCDWWVVLGDN